MTSTNQSTTISLDHAHSLATGAERLAQQYEGVFGKETIERFLHASYHELTKSAKIQNHVPVLAEKFAKQRLRALARVDGSQTDTAPAVLFLCVHNAGRSQMALGFFRHHGGDNAIGWSGGSEPGHEINPAAVAAMAERGIDISGEFPKPWTDETVRAADAVISMGCGDACPIFPGKRYEEWILPDPAGKGIDEVRPVRDEIEQRVLNLLAELGVPTNT